ncbi:MAG: aldehyde ferredoxin oxidoreductase family protein [Anaerolineaceae bacterium]|nr:aldehyde ferredoxin oxidoreductase family protein [Anaerolineaceae bacterium]
MKGIHGKILVVDLSHHQYQIEELPEEIYRRYLGGYGLGAYYLYQHIPAGSDPLGPDNILGFTPGLLTGTGAGFSGRWAVCAKSPLTGKGKRSNGEYSNGGWGNANAGGIFGPAIKRAGFDAIFFKGQSTTPVYLLITQEGISLEDASFLWGKDSVETEETLIEKHGQRACVASIGPAGENLSWISGIVNDKGRIAARSGLGAVMGSKNLKAICLTANKKIEYADRTKVQELNKFYFSRMKHFKSSKLVKAISTNLDYFAPLMRVSKMGLAAPGSIIPRLMGTMFGGVAVGTNMTTIISAQNGDSPVRNYKGVGYVDYPMKKAMNLRGKRLNEFGKKQYGCFSCPLKCGYLLEYDKLPYKDKETHRPEYETVCSFGALILNDDMDLLLKVNEYLNRVGMDSISAGTTVAYVLEGVEVGFFKQEDFVCQDYPNGFLPIWGDPVYILPLLKLMVTREGIGAKLADGVSQASQHFPGTEEFAIHTNGSEMGMHDLRLTKSWGMSFVADPTPGRHTASNYDMGQLGMPDFFPDLKPLIEITKDPYRQGKSSAIPIKMHQVMESLGLCMFVYFFSNYRLLEMLAAVTGWEMDVNEILEIGGRIQTTRQMFNAREGAIRHEMTQRALGSPPQQKGPIAGHAIDIEVMVQGYYEGMGFRQDGAPSAETLRSYGLDEMIPDLAISTGAPAVLINEYLKNGVKR